MRVDKRTVVESILGLAERPEWTERNMDPERAKIDLVLLAARGDVVTVAGMARRWGMPRTSARRVIQTATALVPWLGTYLDSPKNDHVTDHEAACLDTMVDMDTDTMPDSQSRDAAAAPAMLADTMVDMDADSQMDSPQSLKNADHEAEGLDTYLDTMTEPEPGAFLSGNAALFGDVQENEPMDTTLDRGADSQSQDAAAAPAMLADTTLDRGADSPRYTYLDLSSPDVDPEDHAEPTPEDEASVEARAREMAAEAWDCVDARTFETCQGQYGQFWTYRKKHFRELAARELTSETL